VNIQTEHLDNHTVRLTVEVDPERVEKAMRQAAQRIAKKGRIPGFRPGKAPLNVVMNLYGHEYILSEAVNDLGNDIYGEALDASEIEPYAPGALEDVKQEDGLKLIFVVPKRPTVELGDYRELRIPYEPEEVTDEIVTKAFESLREGQAVVETVERPAQIGDQLMLGHFEIVQKTDENSDEAETEEVETEAEVDADTEVEFEEEDDEGNKVLVHQHDYTLVLREGDDDMLPGLSAKLAGVNPGDEMQFELEVPADYKMDDIAGKTMHVEASVQAVQARTIPEWTDELAERISEGDIKNMVDLRADVRKRLEENSKAAADEKVAWDALDKLAEEAVIHYPEEVIHDYLDGLLGEFDQRLRQQGLTLKDYITISGRTEDDLREEYKEVAEKRARRSLVLGEIVRQEKLDISSADIDAEIDRMSQMFGEQSEQFKKFLSTAESRSNIANRIVTDRAIARLAAIAKGENPAVGPAPVAEVAPEVEAESGENQVSE
jgi:trigger factor